MGLCMLLLSLAFYLIKIEHQDWAQWLAIFSMGLFLAFFALGLGATVHAVNAEIYPLHLRATANSLAFSTHWICSYLMTATFLSATKTKTG